MFVKRTLSMLYLLAVCALAVNASAIAPRQDDGDAALSSLNAKASAAVSQGEAQASSEAAAASSAESAALASASSEASSALASLTGTDNSATATGGSATATGSASVATVLTSIAGKPATIISAGGAEITLAPSGAKGETTSFADKVYTEVTGDASSVFAQASGTAPANGTAANTGKTNGAMGAHSFTLSAPLMGGLATAFVGTFVGAFIAL
ncbi:hypothetical protein PYCCODRAFT_1470191 [Trametes coccinea BRFM310]|uniref:Uncharacterized protein n=1 Tax=Trametes coccinea (strain BRFM310) TaxID=1353009 RepID=A0A1Y2IEA7_TRAC3|nr:hypothetical protein PYCCODRAFT_1470191 [Trametes coccinea BRFM310]